jgi:hypothetical protein
MLEQYYNKKTRTLRLPHDFNEELCDLPPNTKIITFEDSYNKNKISIFNKQVGHKECEDSSCPRNLPNSITHLTFGTCFNRRVDNLPNSITHLTFGDDFNQPVNNLPNSITHLTFGFFFDQPVDKLPNSITHLTFGTCFNRPVDNLPNSITHLSFEVGDEFNQPVNNLPNSITHLTVGFEFNQPVDNLPKSIKELAFYSGYKIKGNIPENIENIYIIFSGYEDEHNLIFDNIPCHIKQIKINNRSKINYLKKIPFGCKVVDDNDNEIFLQ